MKTRCDDALLENQRLQDRVDSMEFVRRNYHSSRGLINSMANGSSSYLPPTIPNRTSGRATSMARFTSVERETEPTIPPPYRSREPSVARRNSRDFSTDRWANSGNSRSENESITSNKRRSNRWSSNFTDSPNQNDFSSLPGRIEVLPASFIA